MPAAVLSGFVLALAVPLLYRLSSRAAGWLASVLPVALFIYFARLITRISAGEVLISSYGWVPSLGIELSFYLDGLSLLFAVLITGIGGLIMLYTTSYLAGHPQIGRFYMFMLAFMASMLGLVLSDNVISLFVFWELTSLTSFLLIGFDHERDKARQAAWQALLVTALGGLALLFGFLLIGEAAGGYRLSALLRQGELIRNHPFYVPAVFLLLFGAFTKSAQFPFHFWLPNAMEAPTPVSAYLHSATMVKAGVYLLARFAPVLGGTSYWQIPIVVIGALTMLIGAMLALKETDLKRVLAYSTISILGVLVLLLGLGTEAAIAAAMAYLIVHALYKSALFLGAGILDHETGVRDVKRLGGLGRAMPITGTAAALAALSMAGIPPLFGFIGKELLYKATLKAPLAAAPLVGAALLTSVLLVAVAGMVGFKPFLGERTELPKKPHEAKPAMWLGPLLLAGLGLLIGIAPELPARALISPAATAVLSEPIKVELELFHGLTVQLILSALTIALGVAAYLRLDNLRAAISSGDAGPIIGPEQAYKVSVDGLNQLALLQTRVLQSGHLHFYVLIIIVTTVALVGTSLLGRGIPTRHWALHDIRLYELIIGLIIAIAALLVVRARSRLRAVLGLGVVGYGMALIYIIFGAPDLAITQFLIDTLTIILLVLVLYRLPTYAVFSGTPERIRDAVAAIAAGGLITVLTLTARSVPVTSRLSPFFAENSYLLARGRNVVNVILVDFRALDTLGEITVLSVAAIGVYSLLKLHMD